MRLRLGLHLRLRLRLRLHLRLHLRLRLRVLLLFKMQREMTSRISVDPSARLQSLGVKFGRDRAN